MCGENTNTLTEAIAHDRNTQFRNEPVAGLVEMSRENVLVWSMGDFDWDPWNLGSWGRIGREEWNDKTEGLKLTLLN